MSKAYYPDVYFEHVLAELSKNRKDPCEIVRELIANAYDAKASEIHIYPLLECDGLIFFDNGIGMSETDEVNGITPYKAFFSIGKSTKTFGESIGYKCQGSKLCFDSNKFTLITRCKDEKTWRSLSIDNPKDNLSKTDLNSRQLTQKPWDILTDLFPRPNQSTKEILKNLGEEFFLSKFTQGSLIFVKEIEVEDFSKYYDTNGQNREGGKNSNIERHELSYLRNYIRFYTKHGDVKVLRSKTTGFSSSQERNFESANGYNQECKLGLWVPEKGQLDNIESGYPYLPEPDKTDVPVLKSPAQVSRLSDGRFYFRGANSFRISDVTYYITLAVDGKRRALEKYETLKRQGQHGGRSGLSFTDQRGTFICVQGVKICSYNELFDSMSLSKYKELGSSEGRSHYTLMIDGNFDLVTDRNSLSNSAIKTLKSDHFIRELLSFLNKFYNSRGVFSELIDRLNREKKEVDSDAAVNQSNDLKDGIQYRTRFQVKSVESLKGLWLFAPEQGEESWVGALYTLFSHLVPKESPFKQYWLRPRTFSSAAGLDSIAVGLDEQSFSANVHKGLEYKYSFYYKDVFNHLLTITDHIVSWDMDIPDLDEKNQVKDEHGYYGETVSINESFGYKIVNIQHSEGDVHKGEVIVISLKKLLSKTFDVDWHTPPPKGKPSLGKNARKKR